MLKNVAGQNTESQVVNASTGAAFTGAVTVYVTIDAGTQAVGSVGAGACVHKGNGLHTYAPSQAETNGELVGFTFIGTGAVPVTFHERPDTPVTVEGIVDDMLNELLSGHTTAGTVGKALSDLLSGLGALTVSERNAVTAAVLAAAAATPIVANIKKVNDVSLLGNGSSTPWGPV